MAGRLVGVGRVASDPELGARDLFDFLGGGHLKKRHGKKTHTLFFLETLVLQKKKILHDARFELNELAASRFSKERKMKSVIFLTFLVATCSAVSTCDPGNTFGHPLRSQFLLAANYTNLNHGSYGAVPSSVLQAKEAWLVHIEANSDMWFRYEMFHVLDTLEKTAATFLNADHKSIVFVRNASNGLNAVLRSLLNGVSGFAKKKVLILSEAYQMVKNCLAFLEMEFSQQVVTVNVTYPYDETALLNSVESVFASNPAGTFGFASFSHIVSVPGIILPAKKLVQICKQYGVLAMIDGAHVPGQIALDLTDIGAHIYIGNLHKWMYTPKGSAILYVSEDTQSMIYPSVISEEGQGPSRFKIGFRYEGTDDVTSYMAFPAALQFVTSLGGPTAVMAYTHCLAVQGGQILSTAWNTTTMTTEANMGAMVDVMLPQPQNGTLISTLPTRLLQGEASNGLVTYVPMYSVPYNGQATWFARVSGQVYNDLTDYQRLAEAVVELLGKP